MDEDLAKAVEFHGHFCPGLAIGYRAAKYVKRHYPKSKDEELVCTVENNSCSVDAIQQMLSCTFGKGNLVFRDNGKQVFTFYSRGNGNALRIYFKYDVPKRMNELKEKYSKDKSARESKSESEYVREQILQDILNLSDEELLSVSEVDIPEPNKARIYPTIKCQECGEGFMEIKGRTANGKILCKDCFKRIVS
jgi:formylmethanofuran dehydrogenase subunit E